MDEGSLVERKSYLRTIPVIQVKDNAGLGLDGSDGACEK